MVQGDQVAQAAPGLLTSASHPVVHWKCCTSSCLLAAAPHLPRLQTLAEVCALCNDARIEFKAGHHRAVGQPTEAALLVLAEKLGVASEVAQRSIASARLADPEANPTGACAHHASKFTKLATLEFDRDRVGGPGSF